MDIQSVIDMKAYARKSRQFTLWVGIPLVMVMFSAVYIFIQYASLHKKVKESETYDTSIMQLFNAKQVVRQFTYYSSQHDIAKTTMLFSDSVSRFFLVSNVSRDYVRDHISWYWSKFPQRKNIYNLSSIDAAILPGNNYVVHLKSQNIKNTDTLAIISEFRLNSGFQIYYLRDYFSQP